MAIRSVHLTNAWHPASGGIRTYYLALLEAASRRREHLAVVVPGSENGVEEFSEFGRLYTVRAPFSPLFDSRYRVILPHRYLRSGSAIWQILAKERPDVVAVSDKYSLCHLAGLIKGRAAGLERPTLIGVSHERMDDNVRAWVSDRPAASVLARGYIRKIYLPQFDAHVANSVYTAAELNDAIARRSPGEWRLQCLVNRIHVCPPGVDLTEFTPAARSNAWRDELLRRAGGDPDELLIVHAGRISPEKNVMVLAEMMAALERSGIDARLIVAGDGPSRAEFEAYAARLSPGRVTVLGHLEERHELAASLASADVFVHANPREPFGIAPLEAMATGVPVVLPDSGGVLTYASAANAWLTKATATGLAAAVTRVFEQPAHAARRIRAGLETAEDFRWERATDRLLDLTARAHAYRLGHTHAVDFVVSVRHAKS